MGVVTMMEGRGGVVMMMQGRGRQRKRKGGQRRYLSHQAPSRRATQANRRVLSQPLQGACRATHASRRHLPEYSCACLPSAPLWSRPYQCQRLDHIPPHHPTPPSCSSPAAVPTARGRLLWAGGLPPAGHHHHPRPRHLHPHRAMRAARPLRRKKLSTPPLSPRAAGRQAGSGRRRGWSW